MQQTLETSQTISGVGLHSGRDLCLEIHPAPADHGVVFERSDLPEGRNRIPALWSNVADTRLCTVLANEHGARIGTVEHIMAALRGCGIDNVLICVDGPEIPVMDGSARAFVELIDRAGIVTQAAARRAIRILKPVTVNESGKTASLSPSEDSIFGGEIIFDHPQIGTQTYSTSLVNGNFRHDIADARTFGFVEEVEWMRSQGLALGGSLDNAIVLNGTGILNPGGLRSEDEFIRHKLLDAIGDLYLAGAPILGAYAGHKAGHALNNALLRALFADPSAWEAC